jgi:hypothetical protein
MKTRSHPHRTERQSQPSWSMEKVQALRSALGDAVGDDAEDADESQGKRHGGEEGEEDGEETLATVLRIALDGFAESEGAVEGAVGDLLIGSDGCDGGTDGVQVGERIALGALAAP